MITQTVAPDGDTDILKSQYVVEDDAEFYLTYCKVLGVIKNMTLPEIKTLAWLISKMKMNNNMVVVVLGIKQQIAADMGLSVSSVNHALPGLITHEVLYKSKTEQRGIYYINPEYYWKGELSERKKLLKYVLELSNKGEITLPKAHD